MKISFFLPFILFGLATVLKAQTPQESRGLRVELLVFSGRPNPTFVITDAKQIREVFNSVNALAVDTAARGGGDRPVLGYNGIRVTDLSGTDANVQSFRVRGSIVNVMRKQSAKAGNTSAATTASEVRSDHGMALEARLLALAREHGAIDDRLFTFIKNSK